MRYDGVGSTYEYMTPKSHVRTCRCGTCRAVIVSRGLDLPFVRWTLDRDGSVWVSEFGEKVQA